MSASAMGFPRALEPDRSPLVIGAGWHAMIRVVSYWKAVLAGVAAALAWEALARLAIWAGLPMFDINPIEFGRNLRAIAAELPIMTLSSGARAGDQPESGLDDIAVAHLRKSMLDEDLLASVTSLLRQAV